MISDHLNGTTFAHETVETINEQIAKLPDDAKIVYTYGAWDLLHPGHVLYLARAKALGDFLVVGVVADTPIKNLKGEERPLQTENERLVTSGSLRCVDAAIIQPEYDPSPHLKGLLRVDILTKGDDWEYIPGTETVEDLGGKLVKMSYTEAFSTSKLVSKMDSNNGS